MRLRWHTFKGTAPTFTPTELPAMCAQVATNTKFNDGDLRGHPAPSTVSPAPSFPLGTIRSIYRFGQNLLSDSQYWFGWTQDVNVVRTAIVGDTDETTYFTGTDKPRVTNGTLALGGTPYPYTSQPMGAPAPTTAPTLTPGGTGTGTSETRAYVYTWVALVGTLEMESAPSPATSVTVQPGQTVTLSAMDAVPSGYNVTYRRVYRSVSTGQYLYVGQWAAASSSIVDSVATSALGAQMTVLDNDRPPDTMVGLTAMANGMVMGFVGRDLYTSKPYKPYAYPAAGKISFDYPIVGLAPLGQGMLVLTSGNPYYVSGMQPTSLSSSKLPLALGCVSKRSIVPVPGGVIYASPDGLVYATQSSQEIITREFFDEPAWRVLAPSTITGVYYNDKYIGFYDNGTQAGFVFDFVNKTFADLNFYATAVYVDPQRDALFMVVGGVLQRWGVGPGDMTYTWRSKPEALPVLTNFACARILASVYPVTLTVTADGVAQAPITVSSALPVKLASGFKARLWDIQLSGGRPYDVILGTSVDKLKVD